jgi:hypothetical protein
MGKSDTRCHCNAGGQPDQRDVRTENSRLQPLPPSNEIGEQDRVKQAYHPPLPEASPTAGLIEIMIFPAKKFSYFARSSFDLHSRIAKFYVLR